ncbi:CHITINASE-LIKE PROTEIN [Salix koriyanagi]|uniref:CHITINASE-LIKE PROTEIN n=1 Tax=Salix koriyanagi TaxID=2511006 RepID=A0A9Q1A7W8_9ROSI|nr:CHITINASE-LIKE PROTEIN [Salix koriyanagi]
MKPNLLTADSFLIFNSLTLLSRNSIPFPRNRIPHPNHFLSIVTHPNSAKPSRLLPICSSTNPTRKQSNPVNEESLNSNVEALGGDELEKNFNVQVANPIVPSFIQSWTKLSLSDQAFFLLSFIAFTTSIAFVSLVAAAVPTLYAMRRAATSLSKLADTAREELPGTMAAIRLSGMEISDLTLELSDLSQEITDGVNKSAQAVQAAEAGIRQIGSLAHHHTISMIQERASLPIISLQPVVAGAAKKTSRAVGQATKTIMSILSRGEFSSEKEDGSIIDRMET